MLNIFTKIKLGFLVTLFLAVGLLSFIFVSAQTPPPPVCGNGILETGEECDDANHILDDACDTFGEAPNTNGQCTATFCGDGSLQSPNGETTPVNERCDEGSTNGNTDSACTLTCGAKLLGWAWSDNFGWMSLSCQNLLSCGSVEYYVQVSEEDKVKGWAWSDNIGWTCFGETCSGLPAQYGTGVPAGGWVADVNPDEIENPAVHGWGKFTTLADGGWLSLDCENDTPPCTASGYRTRLIRANFNGQCSVTTSQACSSSDDCPVGENCVFDQRYTLSGWGWNSDESGVGIGWVNFNPVIGLIPPWLQTKYGDIYARGGLTGRTPPGFNATYRLLADGSVTSNITEFYTEQGNNPLYLDPNFGAIDFPTPATRFSNILGELDVDAMLCDFGTGSSCVNQFGRTVTEITDTTLDQNDLDFPLDGKIYYYSSADNGGQPLTIDYGFQFSNGSNFENGAGTIIVDGNLVIPNDLTYDPTDALERFRNLASVAWVVRGDLMIEPAVKNLAGNFIVIGNGTATAPNNCSLDSEVPGCGQIYSCRPYDFNDCLQNRLTVSGLMMARKFYFERTFTDDEEEIPLGSELIIYDGRLLANTPPGLTDFAKALPIWRSGSFSQ